MSYILDALRKSEQQRQATKPENVTDRILVNQPQPKPKRGNWLTALVLGNLVVITGLVWFFMHKPMQDDPDIQTIKAEKNLNQVAKQQPITHSKAETVKPTLVTPSGVKPVQSNAPAPSIAQIIENKKAEETPKPVKKIQDKKPQVVKKEVVAKVAQPRTIPDPTDDIQEEPTTRPANKGTKDINDLPYDVRNNLPNLNINVFSYAHDPQDRFVIIDMVKYKTGQLVKGQVKLKEIRPDSIMLEYGGTSFKVERP